MQEPENLFFQTYRKKQIVDACDKSQVLISKSLFIS